MSQVNKSKVIEAVASNIAAAPGGKKRRPGSGSASIADVAGQIAFETGNGMSFEVYKAEEVSATYPHLGGLKPVASLSLHWSNDIGKFAANVAKLQAELKKVFQQGILHPFGR